ncbi:ThiF family adenylyltransferase [Teredinibacter turnerae]|uniref:ThiF family adenylyltransferase n=1 Tax=Teredinibacter turnerae TaxID=2426 RepID=UPI000425337D|nr:ThiF family adenylyltransferase [Teredinibacter turnerae]
MEYYKIEHSDTIEFSALKFPRSKALCRTISENNNFSLIGAFRSSKESYLCFEAIVVDVECDEVPPNNAFDLFYRERVAIIIHESSEKLVEVLALRKNFPTLMHQNLSAKGSPKNLCLYFEPPKSVLRSWTPQRFLRRIQWWIEKSAAGDIHASDQPVEQPFFTPLHELILPRDFDFLKQNKEIYLSVKEGRMSGGLTFFVNFAGEAEIKQKNPVHFIDLQLPISKHGSIADVPGTLLGLVEVLNEKGIDFLKLLQDRIRDIVGAGIKDDEKKNMHFLFLLNVPVSRDQSLEFDKIHRYAFFCDRNLQQFGLDVGALITNAGSSYSSEGVIGGIEVDQGSLLRINLDWVEVLTTKNSEDFRNQSGIHAAGPKGVLIGAGALGSTILNIWSRMGWGKWSVVDKDHIRPHNLSRHTAFNIHLGENKANIVSHLHELVVGDSNRIDPLVADATDFSNVNLIEKIKSSDVLIDCSTTLEYPRAASDQDEFPRQISVFVTPDGCSTVLLAEDKQRQITLRSLEAQYYRALIEYGWGKDHLVGNLGDFWSGASCRDISVVMPYSSITSASSILSEQIPLCIESDQAAMRIWSRDRETSEIKLFKLNPSKEKTLEFGQYKLFFDEELERKLKIMREACLPEETGGVLLGYYDLNLNTVAIVDAMPAPVDSVSGREKFIRGKMGVLDSVVEAGKRTANIVQYIGEWHSHPSGYSSNPSGDDIAQLITLARGMKEEGLPAVQLIVGDNEVFISQANLE